MCRLTEEILTQRYHGLITDREARQALRRIAKQARFNADYSDTPESHKRWTQEARRAAAAARS